jgi:hypothetical protein
VTHNEFDIIIQYNLRYVETLRTIKLWQPNIQFVAPNGFVIDYTKGLLQSLQLFFHTHDELDVPILQVNSLADGGIALELLFPEENELLMIVSNDKTVRMNFDKMTSPKYNLLCNKLRCEQWTDPKQGA